MFVNDITVIAETEGRSAEDKVANESEHAEAD